MYRTTYSRDVEGAKSVFISRLTSYFRKKTLRFDASSSADVKVNRLSVYHVYLCSTSRVFIIPSMLRMALPTSSSLARHQTPFSHLPPFLNCPTCGLIRTVHFILYLTNVSPIIISKNNKVIRSTKGIKCRSLHRCQYHEYYSSAICSLHVC
jgi:hypothetical protein